MCSMKVERGLYNHTFGFGLASGCNELATWGERVRNKLQNVSFIDS